MNVLKYFIVVLYLLQFTIDNKVKAQGVSEIDFSIIEIIEDKEDEYLIGSLTGIASDKQDNIYLFDFAQNSVLKLDESREFKGKVLSEGRGPGELQSIYAYYLDQEKELIYVADRQNFRFMITDLEGNQVKSFPIHPNYTNPPMGIDYYNEDVLLFKNYVSQRQTMRSVDGIDSLFHFHDSKTFERLFSIGDRSFINKKIGYESPEIGLMNRIMVGKVLFPDPDTFIYSPYLYNCSILIYRRLDSNELEFSESITRKNCETQPFTTIDIDDYEQNREKYRVNSIRKVSTSYSPDGKIAGYINLRSVGLFKVNNGLVLNFIVKESIESSAPIQRLYVDVYSSNLELLATGHLFAGQANELLRDIYWKDSKDKFYLSLETGRFNTKVVVFELNGLPSIK